MFHSELERERYDRHEVYIPVRIVSSAFKFGFMKRFEVIILKKKKSPLRGYPRLFMVNAKEKCLASEISLSDLIDMKARNYYRVSVLKP